MEILDYFVLFFLLQRRKVSNSVEVEISKISYTFLEQNFLLLLSYADAYNEVKHFKKQIRGNDIAILD